MFIIFDSNIWISELGLNSAIGLAIRYFANTKDATIVLPEVVKLETERNLRAELTKYMEELKKNHRQLLTIFGILKEIVLPDFEEIEAKVSEIFSKCNFKLLEIPLTLEIARSSFLRTIDKIPPSVRTQEFKDGILWAECIKLLDTDDVYLVTADKAFYQEREYKKGLNRILIHEADGYKHKLSIFAELSEFLQAIKTNITLDESKLLREYWEINKQSINDILERNSFTVSDDPMIKIDLYITEDANRLYTEFKISYNCEDLTSDGRSDAFLILKGECIYLEKEKEFSDFRSKGEELSYKTKDGENKTNRNIYCLSANIVFGHRTVEHSVKYKLEG